MSGALTGHRALADIPATAIFAVSAVSQYLGAALAVRAFSTMPALGVAWLRVATGAIALAAWRRPWRRVGRTDLALVTAFGICLAGMNATFYLAIDRLPLGTTVAIEFLGPVAVAAIGVRKRRDLAALVLAAVGVALLTEVSLAGSVIGLVCAFAAGVLWAGYIVLAAHVARRGLGNEGLAVAMVAGGIALTPVAAPSAIPAMGDPVTDLLCIGAGLLSSVVPYGLDQTVLRRLSRSAFALLLSLLPATATLIGLIALRQIPRPLEGLGIALVVVAVTLRSPDVAAV